MEREERNPYRWTGTDIDVHVNRGELLAAVRKELLSGRGSAYLLGGTGMGKSVFLHDLEDDLRLIPGVQPILFTTAPMSVTIEALHGDLVDKLVDTCREGSESVTLALQALRARPDPRKAIELYLGKRTDVQVVVLLYDELDDYADPAGHGRQWIKSLESARKDDSRRIKLFAAGGLRLFSVGDSLASPFLSRTRRFLMLPFDMNELRELAKPLVDKKGDSLPGAVLDQILMSSGGNAALATYGLQELWDADPADGADVVEIYEKFRRDDGGFLRRIRKTIADERVSKLPTLFWTAILHGEGVLRRETAEEILATDGDELSMELEDVIALLQSAGLVRLESSVEQDPIRVSAIPSILNFLPRGAVKTERGTLREQLVGDLRDILGLLHSMTLDFFHRGSPAPEDLFAAFIASNLRSRGWIKAEREAILGAGHADISATHGSFPASIAVIEVKIWPRNHKGIHGQVAAYWSKDVEAGAAVMFDVRQDATRWQAEYERDCLDGKATWKWAKTRSPLHGHAVAASDLPSGIPVEIDHFLLHLQRAPTAKRATARARKK